MKKDMARVRAFIHLDHLYNNINRISELVKNDIKLMLIVKANSYGLGAVEIAKFVEDIDFVSFLGVATDDEAIELRENGIKKNILILGYEFSKDYKYLIENDISFCVFDYESAYDISKTAIELNKTAKIHIKIDTGMSRIGFFNDSNSILVIEKISKLANLKLEGIFTHFARADEKDRTTTINQLNDFNDCILKLKKLGIDFELKHCSNSAAILQYPEANMDMVRSGVLAYGISPDFYVSNKLEKFKPVLSIESIVVFVKTIKKGVAISYGGTYTADRDMKIATVPMGYADGYPRSLSNKGYVLINGCKCSVVGRVCMDQFMVDVTDINDVKIGDKVIILGSDKDMSITMDDLSLWSDRIGYELACGIGERVYREYCTSV